MLQRQRNHRVPTKGRIKRIKMQQKLIDAVRMNSSAIIGQSVYRWRPDVIHIRIVLTG